MLNTKNFRLSLVYSLILISTSVIAQTGPGGVGSSTNNVLWLKADIGVEEAVSTPAVSGDAVLNWLDQSGNGNDVTNDTGGAPSFLLSDGRYSVDFEGGSNYLRGSNVLSGTTARTFFTVVLPSSLSASVTNAAWALAPNASAGAGYAFFMETPSASTGMGLRVSGNKMMDYTTSITTPTIFSGNSAASANVTAVNFRANGAALSTVATQTANALNTSALGVIIGGFSNGADNIPESTYDYNGDLYELIAFNSQLNSAEINIIENYLASKYVLTISNDLYAYDTNGGTGFSLGNELAGIGREDASNTHTDATSAGILNVANASGLGDAEYLLFGHDAGAASSWSTSEAPNGDANVQRIVREWRFDETGDVGTVDITIDVTSFATPTTDFDFYQIWIDADGDFSTGATQHTLTSLGGNLYQATGVDLADGDFLTIAIVRPEIELTVPASIGLESVLSPTFAVSLNYPLSVAVTVDYADALTGTASNAGTDYTFTDATLTILANTTSANIPLSVNDDGVYEPDETVIFNISNPSNGILGANTTYTYTIQDDDNTRQIDFSVASANGSEGTTPVNVTVQINIADGSNPTTVDYALSGTATDGGTDYTLTAGTATIPAGVGTSTTIPITITDDLLSEANETIILTLSNSTNSNLGTNTIFTYTINDDEALPTIGFVSSTSFGGEGVSPANISVSLSAISGQDVTIDFADALTGSASNAGSDYTFTDATLTIPAGSTSGSFEILIVDDSDEETPETIDITLSSPSGATLGTSSQTFTINDNDNSGFTGPAGVGNSTNNVLWLRSDRGTSTTTNGVAISSWNDQSGNGNDLAQASGSLQPLYTESQINGLPAVDFDGTDDLMTGNDVISGTTGRSIFITAKTDTQGGSFGGTLLSLNYPQTSTSGAEYSISPEVALRVNGNRVFNEGFGSGNYRILSLNNAEGSDVNATEIYLDGVAGTEASTVAATLNTGSSGTAIGFTDHLNEYLDGSIAEVIAFNSEINDAQRLIVENYLSSKYDISVANDHFAYDSGIPGATFGNEVSGIGRLDASNIHPQAQSDGMLGVNNSDDLGDNEFLLFGHDSGDISSWTSTEVPNGDANLERVAREWRVDETGDVGGISIELDITNLPALSAGFTQYAIFVDSDGDFTNGAITYQTTLVGSLYTASNVAIADGDYICVGIIQSVISFTQTTSNGDETTNPNIEISLNFATGSDVTVDYAIIGGGTATVTSDYVFSSGTATILAGQTTSNIQPGTVNDTDVESDETIIFELSNPTVLALGANTQHTFTINDDDNTRKIDFLAASSNGTEDTSPITVTVQTNQTDATNPTTVDYTVTGTATGGGVDYTLADGTATILATNSSTTFDIVIVDDNIDDDAENILVTLSNPTNSNLGTNRTFTYTIDDDDDPPTIEFLTTTSFGGEGVSPAEIVVSLSSQSGQDVTVDFADAISGSATNGGTDYLFIDGTATILAGSLSTTFSVTLNDDTSEESPETINFTLASPSGATLGANTNHTFTINDNDNTGFTGPGGVGNATNNVLWLYGGAGTSTTTNGAAISSWADQSGNNNDMAQVTGGFQPLYTSNAINNHPIVRFDGTDDLMTGADIVSGTTGRSIFITAKLTSDGGTYGGTLMSLNHPTTGVTGGEYSISPEVALRVNGNRVFNEGFGTTNYRILSMSNAEGSNVTATEIYLDGVAGTELSSSAATLNTGSAGTSLGSTDHLNEYLDGDIAEVIVFNTELNDAERIIVQNYLASKYNLTVTNDLFSFDNGNPGNIYGNDVAGIGRADASNSHSQTQSSGLIGFNNADDLGDGEYLLLGHDNTDASAWSSTEVPDSDSNLERIAREWRVDETGDVGNVSIEIDASNLPAFSSEFTQYAIFVDTDGDFSAGATIYQTSLSGSLYTVSNVAISSGDYITIGTIRPTVQFTASTSNGSETSNPNIEISLNFPAAQNVTVDYARIGGTASDGVDFIFAGGTATILAGQTTTNIQPGTINDTDLESDETIIFELSNPTIVALGSNTQNTFSINDDDNLRKIDFALASSNGAENVSPVSITVQINPAQVDAVNPTTVDYTVTGGTATGSGTDYTLADATATIIANTTSITFDIVLNDDLLDDDAETIVITLSNPTNANLGTNTAHTFTIDDDDAQPTIEFLTTSSSGSEAISPAMLVLSLSAPSGQDITVDYVDALTGTATNGGTDYLFFNNTATITAGNTSTTIDVVLNNDTSVESPETINFTISNPSGASLGTNTAHAFTITDDDNSGITGPGGVGDANNNVLWIKGDAGTSTTTNGVGISSWDDQSGNANDLAQATGSFQPLYTDNVINGKPAIRFDGTDDLMTGGDVISGNIGRTVFITAKMITIGGTYGGTIMSLNHPTTSTTGAEYSISPEVALRVNGNKVFNEGFGTTDFRIMAMSNAAGSDVSATEIYLDGTAGTQLSTSAATLNTGSAGTSIGFTDHLNEYMDGDIAEAIVYNTELNSAQRIIVENYLGAKYGLTIANDLFAHQAIHTEDIAGIGRVDVSNEHTGAQSGGILSFTDPNDLGDNEYLLFGHQNGGVSAWSATEAPNSGANTQRIAREWRLDETGDVGLLTIHIDISALPSLPSGYTQYVVWTDADGDFTSGATQHEMALSSGSDYIAFNVATTDDEYVTIGVIRPTIQFTSATSNGLETISNNIEISMGFAIGENVTVDYNITGGTATNGSVDFNLSSSGTVTIFAGQTTANISPGTINDTDVESDETIEITLTNPSSNATLGSTLVNTYSINDDDNLRKIDFLATSSSGDEGTTPVTITVQINNIDNSNPTTVDYLVTGGTATGSGTDFTLAAGTATVATSTTTTTFDVVIVDDLLDESDETIEITLQNPTNSNLGTNTVYTYTITDNDAAPTVQFTTTSSSVSEGDGLVSVEISLTSISGQDVTIDYADALTGSATNTGVDYTFNTGTATVLAGNTTGNFSLTVINDVIVELPETIDLTISNPSGAALGGNTAHTLTINDNDNSGSTGPGGVGESSNNVLWLRSDAGTSTTTDGVGISSWVDQSGNGNNMSQGSGTLQPQYFANIVNSKPVVRFDGTDDLMTANSVISGSVGRTIFITAKLTVDGGTYGGTLMSLNYPQTATAGAEYSITPEVALRVSGNRVFNEGFGTTNFRIMSLSNATSSDVNATQMYLDGTVGTESSFGSATLNTGSSGTSLGFTDHLSEYLNGDMTEVIVYNTELNSAQRIIVENYLGAKYGITIANDRFAYEGNHSNEIAGIGRVDASNIHTAAQSAGILTLSNANDLGDNEFVVYGHDDGSIAAWTASESPGVGIQKLTREWRLDETGDVGSVSVTIDNTLLPAFDANYTSYLLYVDADGNFATGATSYGLSLVSGSEYEATNVVIADGDYITIAEVQNISAVTGDFDNPNSWVSGVVPTSGDDVTVSGGTVITMTDNHTVGSVTVDGTLNMDSYTLTLDAVGGTPLSVTGTLTVGTGTIEYAGNGSQCVTGLTYNNLTISGTGTKTLCGNVDIDGDLNISSTLDTDSGNDYDINLAGDWISSGSFSVNSSTVTFDGTNAQDIPGSITVTFNDVVINKAANDLNLGAFMNVNGNLTLTSGDIVLNTFDLTIGSSGSIVGGSGTSYIQADNSGTVIKSLTSTPSSIDFQVGDIDEFSPFSFTLNSGTLSSASVSLNLRDAKQGNLTGTDFITRFWTLTPTGITAPNYDAAYTYLDADITGDEDNLGPAKYNGVWENGGTTATIPNLLSWTGITSFSDFTGDDSDAPLPIVLIRFDALVVDGLVRLSWSTASELNNDFFTVERSKNGIDFDEVIQVKGAGNSNEQLSYIVEDENPYNGASFYRLKQTDFDGEFEYFDAKRVVVNQVDPKSHFELYPNPSNGKEIHIRSTLSYISGEEVSFSFTDLSGKVILVRKLKADDNGTIQTSINTGDILPNGVYIVTGLSKFHHSTQVYLIED